MIPINFYNITRITSILDGLYLRELAGSSDFLLLQDSKIKQKELCNITGKAFLTESVMHKNMSLAIGRSKWIKFSRRYRNYKFYPSSQLVQAVGNEWQGMSFGGLKAYTII